MSMFKNISFNLSQRPKWQKKSTQKVEFQYDVKIPTISKSKQRKEEKQANKRQRELMKSQPEVPFPDYKYVYDPNMSGILEGDAGEICDYKFFTERPFSWTKYIYEYHKAKEPRTSIKILKNHDRHGTQICVPYPLNKYHPDSQWSAAVSVYNNGTVLIQGGECEKWVETHMSAILQKLPNNDTSQIVTYVCNLNQSDHSLSTSSSLIDASSHEENPRTEQDPQQRRTPQNITDDNFNISDNPSHTSTPVINTSDLRKLHAQVNDLKENLSATEAERDEALKKVHGTERINHQSHKRKR